MIYTIYNISIISIIIYVILGKYISQGINSNFFDNIFGMIYANSNLEKYGMEWNRPLWFIPCLMALLIIINFFENLIKNIKHKNIIRSFIVIISFSIGIVLAKERIFLPFQIETSCNVMIFTYIGVIIKEIIKKNDKSKLNLRKKPVIEFLFIIITTSLFIYLALNNTASIRENKIGNYFIYLLVGFGMILNTMILSFDIDRYFKRTNWLQYIGQNTMIILLLHKFPILFFQSVLPITKNLLNSSNKLFVVCFAIFISCLVICMCLICDYILKKMKKKKTAY